MGRKSLVALVVVAVVLIGGILALKSAGFGNLASLANGGWLFPFVTAGALIDSLNLCAFTILLLTVGFLFSAGQFHSAILKIGIAYILGIFFVYILIGLGILHALYVLNTPGFMAKIGALLIIVFGIITLLNDFFPSFPIKLKIPKFVHKRIAEQMLKATFFSAFFLGGFVGLFAFPCTGGPYLLVLGLLHDQATYLKGLIYLVYYNLLFVLPLVIMLLIASNKSLVAKIQAWREKEGHSMKFISGAAMILLGIVIFLV